MTPLHGTANSTDSRKFCLCSGVGGLITSESSTSPACLPSWELFEKQDKSCLDNVLPPKVRGRVAIEAGVESGWRKWIGADGVFIGMSSFGASAPGARCFEEFGFTVDNVVKAVKKVKQERSAV